MTETCPNNKRPRPNGAESNTLNPSKRQSIRKRAPLACEECRMRKRKCDGAIPICGGCTKRMSSCVYLADLQEKAWQQDMIQSLRNRLNELERAGHGDGLGQERSGGVNNTTTTAPATDNTDPANNHLQTDGGTIHVGSTPRTTNGTDDAPVTAPPPWLSPQNVVGTSPQPPQNTTSPVATRTAMAPPTTSTPIGSPTGPPGRLEPGSVERLMRPLDRAITKTSTPNTISMPGATPGIPTRNLPATECNCNRLLGGGQWSLPLRRHADELVRLYFARVHRMYPILHKPTFMKQYKQLWEPAPEPTSIPKSTGTATSPHSTAHCSGLCKQKSLDKTFPAMVNAVFALASHFASGTPEQNSARAGTFFAMAQQIDLLDILDEEVGIELVQLLLLMGFYLQSTERFSKCWNITGLAIRMAQNMGLQLSPHDARKKGLLTSCPTQLESEMRVRVWYGCVLLDREISMSFGRPLMINTGGERLRLPEAIDDEYLSDEPGGKWNTQPPNRPSLLESYIQTINLYDILGQVLDREQAKDGSSGSGTPPVNLNLETQSLLDLDTMIMEWKNSLPPYLQYDPPETAQGGTQQEVRHEPAMSEQQADFLAQAKPLHARFLHVRVLILRPALEYLFQQQRHIQPSAAPSRTATHTSEQTRPRVARVQDIILSGTAAQCVVSADSLVHYLDTQIRSQSLVAWWYNIGYLHTIGSTLLMGQLCSFSDNTTFNGDSAPSTSWELCLRCLSMYTSLSSIASKSLTLLQESAKRLLVTPSAGPSLPQPKDNLNTAQTNNHQAICHRNHIPMAETQSLQLPPSPITGVFDSRLTHHHQNLMLDPALLEPVSRQPASLSPVGDGSGHPHMADNAAHGGLDASAGDTWTAAHDSSGNSYWPFMPFLSQLESLPEGFDVTGFEY